MILTDSIFYNFVVDLSNSLVNHPKVLLINKKEGHHDSLEDLTNSIEEINDYPSIDQGKTSLITYTSGTTGSPKGVMLSINNLIYQIEIISSLVPVTGKRFLSILPVNHMFELTAGVFTPLYLGNTIYFAQTILPTQLVDIFNDKKITHMFCVPLVLDAFKNAIQREIKKQPNYKKILFKCLFKISSFISSKRLSRIIFSSIHKKFGGEMTAFFTGGSPLSIESFKFFESLGFYTLQGYGLSETSPVLTMNSFEHNISGSVGKPLPGTELKLLKEDNNQIDGVLLARGPQIMNGYYKSQEQTDLVISSDGWFNTGDIARIDEDNNVYITGREKNLIVLHGGKKVHAEEVEMVLQRNQNISEVCVLPIVKDDNLRGKVEHVCALIVLQEDYIKKFDSNFMVAQKMIQKEILNLKSLLADYKWPTLIYFTENELPKTTTRKMKKKEIIKIINQGFF